MKVHLIRKETIESFASRNTQSRTGFREFLTKLKYAEWESPSDIQDTFSGADLLGNGSDRAILNIGGNKYRMLVKYAFGDKQVHLFICWIGTHAEYDKLCNAREQLSINHY